MRSVKVKLGSSSYDILIGKDIISLLPRYIKKLNIGDSAYIITNPYVRNKYSEELAKVLNKSGIAFKVKTVPDTEKSKSIATLSSVINDLAKFDLKKRVFIVALGGGVVGDLSGLTASIYKRGIPYIQVPTTLLAQVDSSIGGKTAVDLKEGKNLVGAFYQPSLVVSDVSLLKSLDSRQLRTGLAEVIKYGIIRDSRLFAYLEKEHRKIIKSETKALEYIVSSSSKIKADIVGRDEREAKGLRTALNFGHTTAHAVEAAADYSKYTHGEAVALGMLVASDISLRLGLISASLSLRIEALIKKCGLPVAIEGIALKEIMKAIYRDKKFSGAKNRLVLVVGLGKVKIVENVPLKIIEGAISSRLHNRQR